LLFSLDPEVYSIAWVSFKIASTATLFATLIGLPLGFLIGSRTFPCRGILILLLNTLMAIPTVVVGLLVYALVSSQGFLGDLQLLFTPTAIIIGEFFLTLPILINLTLTAVQGVDPRVRETAVTLGAGPLQTAWTILREVRFALVAAVILGFGRAVSEVGVAIMVGGNIKGYTRTLTTAIALETGKGEFGFGLALVFILLVMAFLVNIFFRYLQLKGEVRPL
ncbi:MAG: ABC transporter permease, partial [Deltaproteobacteria bacterium]|nr:ABC transporter permease [Deltaproteobacteria bacterium]